MAIIRITNPRYAKLRLPKKHVSGHDWWRNCNSKRMTLGKLDDPSELACLLAGDCPGSREKFVPIKRSIRVIVPQIMRSANAWRIIQLAICDLVGKGAARWGMVKTRNRSAASETYQR
jgi:hypothetical protein